MSQVYSWRNDDSYALPTYYNSRLKLGDLVFYDWWGDGTIDHAAVVTLTKGTTSDGYRGASGISQHTTDRKNQSWNLGSVYGQVKYWRTRIYHLTR